MANFFPRWTNLIPVKLIIFLLIVGGAVMVITPHFLNQGYARIGYAPEQPIPFSHKIHAGDLGMDCRYCHDEVNKSAHSNIPSANLCWNCHSVIKASSPKLQNLREALENDKPIMWRHVHKMPQYVFFDHSAHVNRGVGCVECHGRIDEMDVVRHEKSMSMGFCVDCHEAPEDKLRPISKVYDLAWDSKDFAQEDMLEYLRQIAANSPSMKEKCQRLEKEIKAGDAKNYGKNFKELWNVNPPQATNCSACHR